jgi:F0F1-type ATP synthase epsilon subunit
MPEKWVSPELLMHYKGANIHHTYNCFSERYNYWYCVDGDTDTEFDIRDLVDALEERGIEVTDASDEDILMLALDNGVLEIDGVVSGRITTTKEAAEALDGSAFFGSEPTGQTSKKKLFFGSSYRDGKATVSATRLGLIRDQAIQIAQTLASIQTGRGSDALHYSVFGESGIIVIRDREITVIADDPKKKSRERLKEAIRRTITEAVDANINVPQKALADGAKRILARMKAEGRPYWTGRDVNSEALNIIQRGLCSMEADYPRFLAGLLKDLNGCLALGAQKGSIAPESISAICRSLNSKLRKARQDAKHA